MGLGLGLGVRSAKCIDTDVAAFQAAGIALGASPLPDSTITALNTAVRALKSAGLWTKASAYYPIVGGTAVWHSLNLKNPALHRLTVNGTFTHNSNGLQGNGVNNYLDTGVDRAVSPEGFVCAYSRSNVGASGTQRDWGQVDGTSGAQWACEAWDAGTNAVGYWGGVFAGNTTDSLGFYLCGQDVGGSNWISKNGVSLGGDFGGSTTPEGNTLYFTANNNDGVMDLPSTRQYSFFGFGNEYVLGDEAPFYTIIQNLQTALGRQV
jgi:hypothetical protein